MSKCSNQITKTKGVQVDDDEIEIKKAEPVVDLLGDDESLTSDPLNLNSYNTFKTDMAKDKISKDELYEDNNLILLNAVARAKSNEFFNAFTLTKVKNPNFISNDPKFAHLKFQRFNKNNDICEFLRCDYSKLFFDIDGKLDEEFETIEGFKQVVNMFEVIKNAGVTCKLCGLIEYNPKLNVDYINESKTVFNKFKSVYIMENEFLLGKSFSGHLFVSGCYFSRSTLHQIFSPFNSRVKVVNSKLSPSIDFTVYKTGQQAFRFILSGKAIKNRPPNPNFKDDFCCKVFECINDFVATKTETDTVLISGEILERFKTFINSYKLRISSAEEISEVRECLRSKKCTEFSLHNHPPKDLNDPQSEWYFKLCDKIALDIVINVGITNEELLKKYDVESEYYTTQTHHNKVRNVPAIKDAIRTVREKGPYEYKRNLKRNTKHMTITKENFKFSIEQFKEFCKYPSKLQALAMVYNNTFCWFSNSSEDKKSGEFIAYINNGEIVIDSVSRLFQEFKNKKFQATVILSVYDSKRDAKADCPISLTFENIASYCYPYRFEVFDFDIYTTKPNILSIYDKPTTPTTNEPVELAEEWKTIFEIYATEQNSEFIEVVNMDKYNFILDWFAYLLQHPESRNKTLLYIAGKQGIGKNLVTNALVKILGRRFCCGDADIDDVCGAFNSLMKNKKFIVINELKTSGYSDSAKKLIDDYIKINEKSKPQYVEENKCSFIIFSNHLNTNIIQKGDRRFAFIYSTALPESKAFYKSFFNGDEYKPELLDNLFNYLLSRDLTNYDNNSAPEFDKQKIWDSMDSKRSPAYLKTLELMKENENRPMLLTDVIEQLNSLKLNDEELLGTNINMRTIRNILDFNDTDDYQIIQNKHSKSYYLIYRYYKPNGPKNAMIEIMKARDNERLEVGEAVKMLADKGFKDITTRTLKRVLNFNDDDNYEIKKVCKMFVVYKNE